MTTVQTPTEQNLQSVLNFDGKDDYVTIPHSKSLDLTNRYTIEAWVNPNVLWGRLVDKGIGGKREGFVFDTYGGLRFINKGIHCTSNLLKTQTWQHVAVVFENKPNGVKLFIDGNEVTVKTPSGIGSSQPQLPTRLGSQADAVGSLFTGKMTEVRFWNKARSQAEIKQDMNHRLTGKEDGLAAYLPLNGDASDQSSNNNNGIINGATWTKEKLDITEQQMLTGGNNVIHRQLVDSDSDFYLVDTNKSINSDGYVNSWKIWADNNLPVQLVIFRQDNNNWSIVGRSGQVTPKTGLNELALSNAIAVRTGDCVGLYYSSRGSVSATKNGTKKGGWKSGKLDGTVLRSHGANFDAFTESGYRTYSVQVNGAPGIANVEIVYHGHAKQTQSDEYVEICNSGNAAADLSNWRVTAIGSNKIFVFPEYTCLSPGQMIRVYTNEVHQESGGFSFGSKTAIWNDKGDVGKLSDAEGKEVSSFSYGNQDKSENSVDSIKAESGISGLKVNISEKDIKQLTTPQTKVSFFDAFHGAIKSFMADGNLSESPLNILQELPGEYGLPKKPSTKEINEKMKKLLNECGIKLLTDAEDPADKWAGKVMCDETGESYGTNSYWIFKLSPSQFTDMNYAVVDKEGVKPTINWGSS